MQVAPEQAAFLTFLTRLLGVRRPSRWARSPAFVAGDRPRAARGRAADLLDISEEFTGIARRYWARAGVDDRIELRIGPAGDTLRELPHERHLDFAFIDADKTGYPVYWAELVPRMRPGGVIAVDNVLRGGRVIAPQNADDRAIAAFNDEVLADVRVDAVMLPIADGLTLARVH